MFLIFIIFCSPNVIYDHRFVSQHWKNSHNITMLQLISCMVCSVNTSCTFNWLQMTLHTVLGFSTGRVSFYYVCCLLLGSISKYWAWRAWCRHWIANSKCSDTYSTVADNIVVMSEHNTCKNDMFCTSNFVHELVQALLKFDYVMICYTSAIFSSVLF